MGSGIAAHLANAGVPTLLLDVVPTELSEQERRRGLTLADYAVRNRPAREGLEAAAQGRRPGFAHPARRALVTPGNLEDDLGRLAEVDWVVEAVVERLDVKSELLARAASHVSSRAWLTTNTSGLSVNALSATLPEGVRPRFFGTHFFNPPRHMYLLELIPAEGTEEAALADFQRFAELRLGKGVVRGKDTPNFIANRIFIFSTVYAAHAMERHGLTVEEVDAVTGRALGRAATATFGTSDLAGIDVLAHAVRTHYEGAPQDEWRELMRLPAWIAALVERGTVGNKAGAGFYKDKRQLVVDPASLEYRLRMEPAYPSLLAGTRNGDAGARASALVSADDAAGRFAWDLTASTLLYAAHRLPEISDDILAIDQALRWGMGWELGPFELWDALGLAASLERMEAEGRAIPAWVREVAASPLPSFYGREGAAVRKWDLTRGGHATAEAPAWRISLAGLKRAGGLLRETEDAALVDLGDGVACLEFRTKANVVSVSVLDFVEEVLERAGHDYEALVIGNQGPMFSAGADLKHMVDMASREDWEAIDGTLRRAQQAMMGVKYAPVPVVGTPFGRALGGGLEVCLHCHRLQAAQETQMGLVESSVGLIPGAGGVKETLLRGMAAAGAAQADLPILKKALDTIAAAKTTASAWEGFDLNFMRPGDGVTMNREGLLHAAKQAALALLATGWQPLVPARVRLAGRDGLANLRMYLHILRQGGHLSDHDRLIGDKVAWVLAGGEVDPGQEVDEQYLLDMERAAFLELCREPKSLERARHMLVTGKPLRN
jgi:3-hydroxyacyl-CoA dehydrogenase